MALHLTGTLGLNGGNRRRWPFARPEAASSVMLMVIAAMFVTVAIYGAHLLSRHVDLADHARAFSTALILNETVGDLDDLRTAAHSVTSNSVEPHRDELQRRLRIASERLDLLNGDAFRASLGDSTALEPLTQHLRTAIAGAEDNCRLCRASIIIRRKPEATSATRMATSVQWSRCIVRCRSLLEAWADVCSRDAIRVSSGPAWRSAASSVGTAAASPEPRR